MKLVFYGGGEEEDNFHLDELVINTFQLNAKSVLTYIPSSSYDVDISYDEFSVRFSKFGIHKILCMPIDIPIDKTILNVAFQSDFIYLEGGNTYYFLYYLKQMKLMDRLIKFVKDGGILAGLSAGALLMTKNIKLAGFPDFDKDDNEVGLNQLSSLGLVDFQIFPHYVHSKRYKEAFCQFTIKNHSNLFAIPDSSGIIINGPNTIFHGKIYVYSNGLGIKLK